MSATAPIISLAHNILVLTQTTLNLRADSSNYLDNAADSPELTDWRLLRQVSTGDENAFAELYSRYNVSIFNYLIRLVHDRAAAEELLQEVFLGLWNGAAGFKRRSSVKSWVFRIAHYQAVSWLRRQKKIVLYDEENLVDQRESVESSASQSWREDQVRRAVQELTPIHRAVVELAFVHNLTYAEIAVVLDCPIGTVKSRMSYALRIIDGILKQWGIEE